MITIEDYRLAIRKHFENTCGVAGFPLSMTPTPAEMKNRAIALIDTDLPKEDRTIILRFFGIEEEVNVKRKMGALDPARFRPVQSVYLTDVASSREPMLNMAALLIDFKPRPFQRFRLGGLKPETPKAEVEKVGEPIRPENGPAVSENLGIESGTSPKTDDQKTRKKAIVAVAGVFTVFAAGFGIKHLLAENRECMQWQTDNYILVDCKITEDENSNLKIGYNDSQYELRRIPVSPGTEFFRDGKPIVWYLKHDGGYEFFNRPGYHPELRERALLPVSRHIAMQVYDGEIKTDY